MTRKITVSRMRACGPEFGLETSRVRLCLTSCTKHKVVRKTDYDDDGDNDSF